MSSNKFYNNIAGRYDAMIRWRERTKKERPFFEHLLKERRGTSILDCGCGTGEQAIAWAEKGYRVMAIDPSPEMIDIAKAKSKERDVEVDFRVLEMEKLDSEIHGTFDLVSCFGNTLAHVLDETALTRTFKALWSVTEPGGLIALQLLNYTRIISHNDRFYPSRHGNLGNDEYVFVRFFDFGPTRLTFNLLTLHREDNGWSIDISKTSHYPWQEPEIRKVLEEAGFEEIIDYGDCDFAEFDSDRSKNLIIVAERGRHDISV